MEITDPIEEQIFLDALTTYADSCKLPELTESCPFYRVVDGLPTCGEECRRILERLGVDDRPVVDTLVGGLRMLGRQLPITVAAGTDDFDATRHWLQERDLPIQQQSTAAILTGLRIAARWNLGRALHDSSLSMTYWGELLRRGIDMDRVYRGGVAPELAEVATIRAIAEILTRDEVIDATPILGDERPLRFPLAELIDSVVDQSTLDPHVWVDPNMAPLMAVLEFNQDVASGEVIVADILRRKDIQFVISQGFSLRMQEWFSGLLGHDLEAALRADLPSADMLRSTPGRPRAQTIGRWLWERFTITDPAMWEPSSLLLEWQWARGSSTDACNQRTMNERRVSAETIGLSAMKAFETADGEEPEENLFQPAKYVQLAANHLAAGEWDKAARIFAGLVELSPGDGEAWNNLGFCLLGENAALGLPHLERGASLRRPTPVLSVANQVLALHLLGRDDEALARADSMLASGHIDDHNSATIWLHPVPFGELELGHTSDTRSYLSELRAHIATHDCDVAGMDN